MARKKSKNISGYFRTVFAEHPEWLNERSNDLLLARYREDHNLGPDARVPRTVRTNLANLKSLLRRGEREGKGVPGAKGKPGRPRKSEGADASAVISSARRGNLSTLEERIDDCLLMAKNLDRDGLDHVIRLLRSARNEVVWKSGQP